MNATNNPVFDYRALRLVMGIIAFSLPFVVSIVSSVVLTSISASYYTEARNLFVGLLFVVGAFLLAYNGHDRQQMLASKIAALSACGVALFPTNKVGCPITTEAIIHYASAVLLFSILAYFCFRFFRMDLINQIGKRARRRKIYFACGCTMLASMGTIALANIVLNEATVAQYRIVYWGEAIALMAFGVAWFTSGKAFEFIADEDERYRF